ncbi:MAG TPA: serine/threonine-protein kinase, partial [Isosphaeraceae bacterium]|nr:serine/threonine-protein kinase [Isosphaeraceae bacterium]
MKVPDPDETIAQHGSPASQQANQGRGPHDGNGLNPTIADPGATLLQGATPGPAATLPLDVRGSSEVLASVSVPGYELLGELGRGGMGVVYKARQVGLNRLVALKMILAGAHASREAVARFRTEAETVASIQHANIVQIYDIGEQDGVPYFSLEFVDGGNLATQLDGAPVSARQAATIVETLARAVHVAHERGIVHRDLKPINVLMTSQGVPKIADFGLAKRLDGEQGQTASGSVLGSPSYMAPEQAEGDSKNVGAAADVYALGAILYDLLTGRPPFRAETAIRTMQQVISVEPVAPSRLQPGLDSDVETICLTCLQKDPEKRYKSAEALANDLRNYLEGKPIQARPVSAAERLWRWCKRNPVLAFLGASVLLLLSVVAVGATIAAIMLGIAGEKTATAYRQAQLDAERAGKSAIVAERERDRADEKAAILEQQVYRNSIALAGREWRENHVVRAERLLDACAAPLRRWEWYYLKRLCHSELRTITGPRGCMQSLALNSQGTRAATGGSNGMIRLWNTETGKEAGTFSGHTWSVTSLAFAPSGDRLVSGSLDQTVRIWDTASGSAIRVLEGHEAPVRAVAFNTSGDLIASAAGDDLRNTDELKVWDAATGRLKRSIRTHSGIATAVAFGRDNLLASAGTDGTVR